MGPRFSSPVAPNIIFGICFFANVSMICSFIILSLQSLIECKFILQNLNAGLMFRCLKAHRIPADISVKHALSASPIWKNDRLFGEILRLSSASAPITILLLELGTLTTLLSDILDPFCRGGVSRLLGITKRLSFVMSKEICFFCAGSKDGINLQKMLLLKSIK